eukprot:12426475-Karenia_brevis.AAC.1
MSTEGLPSGRGGHIGMDIQLSVSDIREVQGGEAHAGHSPPRGSGEADPEIYRRQFREGVIPDIDKIYENTEA